MVKCSQAFSALFSTVRGRKFWCNDMQARSQMQCALLKLLHWAAHHILFDQPFIMILCAQASWHSVVQAAAGTCSVLTKTEATPLCRGGVLPVPGAGGLYAAPGVPVELVLTGMGGAKPGIPGAPGAWTEGPATCRQGVCKMVQGTACFPGGHVQCCMQVCQSQNAIACCHCYQYDGIYV